MDFCRCESAKQLRDLNEKQAKQGVKRVKTDLINLRKKRVEKKAQSPHSVRNEAPVPLTSGLAFVPRKFTKAEMKALQAHKTETMDLDKAEEGWCGWMGVAKSTKKAKGR
jgi:hypothetical protein